MREDEPVTGQQWPELLAEAWAALDADGPAGASVAGPAGRLPAGLEVLWVSGAPGLLPSRLPAEEVAIACTAAALLAAAALHAQRGGDGGSRGSMAARLDRAHVAAAFRSEAYLRVDGEKAAPGFAPLSRFWRTADGWVRTHGNYPWHRAALLRALGCAGDTDAVAAALAGLGAREAEDLVTGAGGVAAAVRAESAWRDEPPGRSVAATALVEPMSIGTAPPRWRAAGPLPASGVRVLDLTRVIAGPVATRYLAALGADVLRLDGPDRPELTLHAYDGLPGKRSALLDFGTAEGRARLHELLSAADVLVHGYRPHALERFGLGPQELAERHPGLVVVGLSAWGSRGPWGARRGFDSIVQAAAGIALAESPDGERPGALPCQLLDHGTGYLCAAAALRALARQSARGGTLFRELSLARTAHWLLGQPRMTQPGMTLPQEARPREARPGDGAAAPGSPDRAGQAEPAWLTTLASSAGPVTMVRPPGQLDGEPLTWREPLSRYGGDEAAWTLPGRDQGEVGLAEQAVVAAQPVRAVLVDSGPDLGGPGMIAVGREPLLLIALVTRLEVLPLLRRGGLDPGRAEARRDGQVDHSGQVTELPRGRAGPHAGQFGLGRRPVPEPFGEQHPATRIDQAPEFGQGGLAVRGRLDLGQRVAGADAQHQVGRAPGGPDGGLADERGPAAEPAGLGAGPAPGQVAFVGIQAEAGRRGHRREDAEHQLTPAAADVEHGPGLVRGEPGDDPGRPGLGQRAVEGEPGQARRESGVSRMRVSHIGRRLVPGWRSRLTNFRHGIPCGRYRRRSRRSRVAMSLTRGKRGWSGGPVTLR